jgi:hypothetical protein
MSRRLTRPDWNWNGPDDDDYCDLFYNLMEKSEYYDLVVKPEIEANQFDLHFDLQQLCLNEHENTIKLIEKLVERNKININDWNCLCENKKGVHIIEKHMNKLENNILGWHILSSNPSAMHILKDNQTHIDWKNFSMNSAIFELDYDVMKQNKGDINRAIIEYYWHPLRVQMRLDNVNDIDDEFNL